MRWVLFTTMGRQSRSSVLAALLGALWSGFCMVLFVWPAVDAAIVAPPWSNPSSNPCALQPGGWQLLYWAPLKKCFKIFTVVFSLRLHVGIVSIICFQIIDRISMSRDDGTESGGQFLRPSGHIGHNGCRVPLSTGHCAQ